MPPVAAIETDRLLLREQRPGDAPSWAEFLTDPDFRRYIPVRRSAFTPEERAERNLGALMARWDQTPLTAAGWVVTRQSDGQVIGIAGVDQGEVVEDGEIDYFLAKPFWGQGYGREAAHAIARFTRDRLPFRRLVAYIVRGNTGSIRIAESLGLRFEREVDYLQFFPDPSQIELADSITRMYAAPIAEVTLRAGRYKVIEAAHPEG